MTPFTTPLPTYDNDMNALSDAIKVVVSQHTLLFKQISMKYKHDFSSKSGQLEFEEFLQKIIPIVDKMLSSHYKNKTISKYFSDYGLIAVTHGLLKSSFLEQFEDNKGSF